MSVDEVIGVAMLAALAGGLCGGMLAARGRNAASSALREQRRIDAALAWLAARAAYSRASVAFVRAFRALASEHRDSPDFAARRALAARTKRRWRRARIRLTDAENAMSVWCGPTAKINEASGFSPSVAEVRRVALRGTDAEWKSFVRRIRESDDHAVRWARIAGGSPDRTPTLRRMLPRWADEMVTKIIRSWDRPPARRTVTSEPANSARKDRRRDPI